MTCRIILSVFLACWLGPAAIAQTAAAARPPIVGIAHVALQTSDLDRAREFYGKYLGYAEAYTIMNLDGSRILAKYFKVNDHQYIEVWTESRSKDRLIDIAFETANAEQLREYLAGQGVAGFAAGATF